jgi:hypothetical protein
MEEQRNTTPAWEAMEVEEVGHVGEVLQVTDKVSPITLESRSIPETS